MKQKSRGQDGFGLFNGQHIVKAATEDRILRWLGKPRNSSSLILFHHRWPTSTINVRRAAHPFSTKAYFGNTEYILVHNGVVNNADTLFTRHQELGIDYQSLLEDLTFNDSEALLWDFALTMENKQSGLQARGGMAIVCIKLVDGELDTLYFGRNHYPLHMEADKKRFLLASEGTGPQIASNTLYSRSYKDLSIDTREFEFPTGYSYNNYRDYDYEPFGGHYRPSKQLAADILKSEAKTDSKPLVGDLVAESGKDVAMTYLLTHEGRFSEAYWSMQADYSLIESSAESEDEIDELRRLQRGIFWIEEHPDYTDDNAISKEWSAACQQLALA